MNDLSLLYPCHICVDNFVCGAFFTSYLLSSDSTNSYLKENADTIVVDSGGDNETLVGGLGNDIFVMSPNGGTVSIIDFDPDEDKIDLGKLDLSFKQVIGSMQEMLTGCAIRINDTKVIEIKNRNDSFEKGCKAFIKEDLLIKLLPGLTQATQAKENSVRLLPKFEQSVFPNGYQNGLSVIIACVFVVMTVLTAKIFASSVENQRPVGIQGPVTAQRLRVYFQYLQTTEVIDDSYHAAALAA